MNNKGFMMAEVVVVSSVILVTLTGLYMSYNKILSIYNQRINYYDVKTIYTLANYRETKLNASVSLNPLDNTAPGEKIYYANISDIKNGNLKNKVTNLTFKDYLEYLSGSLDFNNINNLLVMERCDTDGTSNCKYAYLEVYHNEETSE